MKEYNKLVRDQIIEIIKANGGTPEYHTADEAEFRQKAVEKLGEEMAEFILSGDPEELIEIQETLILVAQLMGLTPEELEAKRLKKVEERGAFTKRIILERS